ncbi:energy-coupling factor ABC transporter ATP-binding protein [Tessaracoccus sp. ZS01]|uniref:energy-coupling factor ABC transporter ATP-binding protein n=1 Tax=Tessaracoccus sp. ZS01 TaxID=1906324 RepID=UPI003514AAAA
MGGGVMLVAEEITVAYPERPVLAGASVQVGRGKVALLGANGSGKTTLLQSLAGALELRSGRVLLDGQPLQRSRAGLRAHRRRVQLVLQDPDDQLFSADVRQDVSFGPLNLGLSETDAAVRVDETLRQLGIAHLAARPTHRLSYGERKRVALAGAVAMRPDYLLLDEPTAGLDPEGVHELLAALDGLDAGILLATHHVAFALAWADEVAVVVDGRVRQGPVSLLNDAALLTAARLHRPWPLELAGRLGLAGTPRHLDDVTALLEAR